MAEIPTPKRVAPRAAPETRYLRLRIEGLQSIDHEPGIFELKVDGPIAELPDLSEAFESIVAGGFDREVVDLAIEKFVTDLNRRQLMQYFGERVRYA